MALNLNRITSQWAKCGRCESAFARGESTNKEIEEDLKDYEAPLKDAAITILSAQTPESVETPAGKDVLRRNLMTQFNRLLGADVIGQVYFKEFVIQ